jgi:hypothetical protein
MVGATGLEPHSVTTGHGKPLRQVTETARLKTGKIYEGPGERIRHALEELSAVDVESADIIGVCENVTDEERARLAALFGDLARQLTRGTTKTK